MTWKLIIQIQLQTDDIISSHQITATRLIPTNDFHSSHSFIHHTHSSYTAITHNIIPHSLTRLDSRCVFVRLPSSWQCSPIDSPLKSVPVNLLPAAFLDFDVHPCCCCWYCWYCWYYCRLRCRIRCGRYREGGRDDVREGGRGSRRRPSVCCCTCSCSLSRLSSYP